jgi:signal transduction histidine kinase
VRRWLARELHDDVIGTLTTVLLDIEELRRELRIPEVSNRLVQHQASVRAALTSLRRLLTDLRDQSGEDHLLIEDLTALLERLDDRAGIKGLLLVSPAWPRSLSAHIGMNLRRITEEALRNAALHSGAKHVRVSLDAGDGRLTLTVSDDGRGCHWPGATPMAGAGLLGMQERALILGGHLEVTSEPGTGTTVRGVFAPACA